MLGQPRDGNHSNQSREKKDQKFCGLKLSYLVLLVFQAFPPYIPFVLSYVISNLSHLLIELTGCSNKTTLQLELTIFFCQKFCLQQNSTARVIFLFIAQDIRQLWQKFEIILRMTTIILFTKRKTLTFAKLSLLWSC